MLSRFSVLALTAVIATVAPRGTPSPAIEHVAVPDNGIQPQAAYDAAGTLHVIFYKGEPAGGDIFYTRRGLRDRAFATPIRVNSQPGSAIAAGAVRGGRLALGRDGWVHVTWNASHPVERDGESITPMWYARLAPGAAAFEPQRAIGAHTKNLDGGGTVAADAAGRVFVVWHAMGTEPGEAHRQIFVAASADDGAHFAPDAVIANPGGACGCCGASALVDGAGRLQVLYRSAADGVHRDASWITIDGNHVSPPLRLQPWELPACPMTTFAMAERGGVLVGAWMVAQQIYTADLDERTRTASAPSPMGGTAVRNHPALALDGAGDRLVAWIEGANRSRPGSVAWELRDGHGVRRASNPEAGAIPPLSLIAAVPRPGGGFLLLF